MIEIHLEGIVAGRGLSTERTGRPAHRHRRHLVTPLPHCPHGHRSARHLTLPVIQRLAVILVDGGAITGTHHVRVHLQANEVLAGLLPVLAFSRRLLRQSGDDATLPHKHRHRHPIRGDRMSGGATVHLAAKVVAPGTCREVHLRRSGTARFRNRCHEHIVT